MICYSDSESWDYMPLVSSVIPANLGYRFTLLCGHYLRLERTGNMEIQRACLSTGFVWWRMYLLALIQILQSTLLAVHSCPALCACTYGNSGIAELRLSEADFIFMSVFLCVKVIYLYMNVTHYILRIIILLKLYWNKHSSANARNVIFGDVIIWQIWL